MRIAELRPLGALGLAGTEFVATPCSTWETKAMGLDIYVGTLTRYHRNDWLTVVQQLARDGEIPEVRVLRPGASPEPPLPEDEARAVVVQWRHGLAAGLAEHGVPDVSWDEAYAGYFTDGTEHERTWLAGGSGGRRSACARSPSDRDFEFSRRRLHGGSELRESP